MKAAVVYDLAESPRYATIDAPTGEGTPVTVLAAALSPRARSGASGAHYASRAKLPLIAGIDGVGQLADGRRVYFLGADDAGTMAERALAESRLLVPIPDHLSSATIAAGMLPAISSWAALTARAPLQQGQRVLVLGATGVSGHLAVQIAKHLGASEVIAAGRDAKALATTGATRTVELGDAGAVAAVASEVDIVLDYLWGSVTSAVMPAICRARRDDARALRWVLIGSVTGDEIHLSSVLLRKRNLQILGSGQGATSTRELFGTTPAIVEAFAAGILSVRAKAVPLAEVSGWWNAPIPSGERLVFVP